MAAFDVGSNDAVINMAPLEQAVGEQVDAAATSKLPRALAGIGVLTGSMAAAAAVYKAPRGVLFHGHELAYYLSLGGVFAAGVAEVWAALWVHGDVPARHAVGKSILCASVVPLVVVVGLGGFAVQLKK